MTTNQINYWANVERERANRSNEAINYLTASARKQDADTSANLARFQSRLINAQVAEALAKAALTNKQASGYEQSQAANWVNVLSNLVGSESKVLQAIGGIAKWLK